MKASTLIHAAALFAIASTPAHAYFINYYPWGFKDSSSAAVKTRKTSALDEHIGWQSQTDSATPGFSNSQHGRSFAKSFIIQKSPDGRLWFAPTSATFAANANTAWPTQHFQQDDFQHDSTTGDIDSNDSWPIDVADVEKISQGKTDGKAAGETGKKWTDALDDKNQDRARSENPYAPSPIKASASATVPEPASLGLITLGLSALALSRRRAHKSATQKSF